MTSYLRLQTNVLAKFVDITCILFYTHFPYLLCHGNEHKLSALQVRRPEQNTAFNAKTERFMTAKISGNALKPGSRTHSVSRQRSSQLQKYKPSGYFRSPHLTPEQFEFDTAVLYPSYTSTIEL